MYQITIIRADCNIKNQFSTDYYSIYAGEIVLHKRGFPTEFIPLYEYDSVFVMNESGKTVDKWSVPKSPTDVGPEKLMCALCEKYDCEC